MAERLDSLQKQGALQPGRKVLIAGSGAVGDAWVSALERIALPAVKLADVELEAALLAGLRAVVRDC